MDEDTQILEPDEISAILPHLPPRYLTRNTSLNTFFKNEICTYRTFSLVSHNPKFFKFLYLFNPTVVCEKIKK